MEQLPNTVFLANRVDVWDFLFRQDREIQVYLKREERERKIHLFSFASLSTPTKKIKRGKKLMK